MDKRHDKEQRQENASNLNTKTWAAPTWSYVGDVEDVVQGGEGKISVTEADPGEPKKTRPSL